MWRIALIVLLAGFAACSSPAANMEESDPFTEARPVDGGLYADLPDAPAPVSGAVLRALNDEWEHSLAGWSFTTRAIGRWTQRDWDRLFGDSE